MSNTTNIRNGPVWVDAKCPVCGRDFLMTNPECWVYKRAFRNKGRRKIYNFCSYTCTCKADREVSENKRFTPLICKSRPSMIT